MFVSSAWDPRSTLSESVEETRVVSAGPNAQIARHWPLPSRAHRGEEIRIMSHMKASSKPVTPSQKAAIAFSIGFLVVGVLGFVPGITTNLDDLAFAGHETDTMLLGLFQVSILHNIVHLLLGVIGLATARTASGAYVFLIGGGIVYLALWIYGLIIDRDSSANFVPLNTADNWLHLGLGAAMILLGLALGRGRPATTTQPTPADRI
jgi:hypothetical protein